MALNNNNRVMSYELPIFYASIDNNDLTAHPRIPREFRKANLFHDKSKLALLSLNGFPQWAWECEVVYFEKDIFFGAHFYKFCAAVSEGNRNIYLVFNYEGIPMRFTVTRFDCNGHMLRSPPNLYSYQGPPLSVDGLEHLKEELLCVNTLAIEDHMDLPMGRFVEKLIGNGLPATYTMLLETHPSMCWNFTVGYNMDNTVGLQDGWLPFAYATGMNGSQCIRLKLHQDGGTISVLIFNVITGAVTLPDFDNQGLAYAIPPQTPATVHRAIDMAGSSNQSAIDEDVNDDEVWQGLGELPSSKNLEGLPNCTCVMYSTFGLTDLNSHTNWTTIGSAEDAPAVCLNRKTKFELVRTTIHGGNRDEGIFQESREDTTSDNKVHEVLEGI